MRDNYSPITGHEWFLGLQQRFTNKQNVTLGQLNCFSSLENILRIKQGIRFSKRNEIVHGETKAHVQKFGKGKTEFIDSRLRPSSVLTIETNL